MRIKLVAVLLATALCAGCSSLPRMLGGPGDQERSLQAALEELGNGQEKEARRLLEGVIEAPPQKGITDEALFRLALLSLRDEGSKGAARAQTLLEQLRSAYPRSIWTSQASPLVSRLAGIRGLHGYQRELKVLREQNLSLMRDNRDLRQTIERLKNLDRELEPKPGR